MYEIDEIKEIQIFNCKPFLTRRLLTTLKINLSARNAYAVTPFPQAL